MRSAQAFQMKIEFNSNNLIRTKSEKISPVLVLARLRVFFWFCKNPRMAIFEKLLRIACCFCKKNGSKIANLECAFLSKLVRVGAKDILVLRSGVSETAVVKEYPKMGPFAKFWSPKLGSLLTHATVASYKCYSNELGRI